MCFSCSLTVNALTLANRYDAPDNIPFTSQGDYLGFTFPSMPILTAPQTFTFAHWGLVPAWTKNNQQAESMRSKTLNARAETISEKPSFKEAFKQRRCIVPVTSYYEYHHNEDGTKTKYSITEKREEIFSLAGIWEEWRGPQSGKTYTSFSIITCPANPLLAEIHNSKKRMPVILQREEESYWLSDSAQAPFLLKPYSENLLVALPASR